MKRADPLWLFLLSLSFYLSHNVRHQPSLSNFYSALILFIPHMSCLHTATSFFSVCHVFLGTSSVISLHPLSFFLSFNIIIPFIGFCPSHFLLCCERLACWKQVTVGKVIRQDGFVWKWMWLSVPMTLGPSSQNTSMTHLLSLSFLSSAENTTARRAREPR